MVPTLPLPLSLVCVACSGGSPSVRVGCSVWDAVNVWGERVRPSADYVTCVRFSTWGVAGQHALGRAAACGPPTRSCIHPKCFRTELTQCRALRLARLLLDTNRVPSKYCYCPGSNRRFPKAITEVGGQLNRPMPLRFASQCPQQSFPTRPSLSGCVCGPSRPSDVPA